MGAGDRGRVQRGRSWRHGRRTGGASEAEAEARTRWDVDEESLREEEKNRAAEHVRDLSQISDRSEISFVAR